jgi:hypothetical protein
MTEAKVAGLTRYFTGKPCPRGHIAERIVSTRACAECVCERKHAWSKANPEKVNAQRRSYYKANPEKVKAWKSDEQKRNREAANERNRRYAATHRKQIRLKNLAWEQANPDRVVEKVARRRAAKINQMPCWADRESIKAIYREATKLRRSGLDVHVDHILPLQGRIVSGLHVHHNLQIIDAQANRVKSNNLLGAN